MKLFAFFATALLIAKRAASCRESVCRRRRSASIDITAWGKCTPWQVQMAHCLSLDLTIFTRLLSIEWFFDFVSKCDYACRQSLKKKTFTKLFFRKFSKFYTAFSRICIYCFYFCEFYCFL